MAPVLGYWNIRGLAQPIRYLLAYTGTEYKDKRYAFGPAPEFDRSSWLNEKFTLGLDFPNNPYYIDGDIKITQSLAILRHLARKHKLDGATEQEKIRIDMVEQQLTDNNMAFARICYDPNFETLKVEFLKNLPNMLELLSKFLGDCEFFAGNNITYVDFMAYEILEKFNLFAPEIVGKFQNLKQFMTRIAALPAIAKYLNSDDFADVKKGFNGDMAKFGSKLNA